MTLYSEQDKIDKAVSLAKDWFAETLWLCRRIA